MTTDATRATCIDAERLAAWADRGLPADEAAAVELHLSQCAYCQEVLAAFARNAPAAAVVIPFWARRPVQWSAGLAAAAAVVFAVWTQRAADVQLPESTVALDRGISATPAPQPLATPPVSLPPREEPVPQQATPQKPRERPQPLAAQPSPPPPLPAMPPPPAVAAPRAVMPPPDLMLGPPPKPVLPPSPPAGAPGRPLGGTAAPPPAVTMQVPLTLPGRMAQQSASDAFSAEVLGTIEIAPPVPVARSFDAAARAGGRAGGGAGRGGGGAAARPLGPTRWRIVGGTRVERTVDNGATWAPVVIDPPLTAALTTGTATSPTVCWLAGRDGVVLVTADGVTFRRVPLPEVVQVIGVTAQDALRALATTADGRVFETTDAGATWRVRDIK